MSPEELEIDRGVREALKQERLRAIWNLLDAFLGTSAAREVYDIIREKAYRDRDRVRVKDKDRNKDRRGRRAAATEQAEAAALGEALDEYIVNTVWHNPNLVQQLTDRIAKLEVADDETGRWVNALQDRIAKLEQFALSPEEAKGEADWMRTVDERIAKLEDWANRTDDRVDELEEK